VDAGLGDDGTGGLERPGHHYQARHLPRVQHQRSGRRNCAR
jgi:hypothetical protein